jgi:ABC-type uncharacterized transport system involved in gliding motility auxiliary subunit
MKKININKLGGLSAILILLGIIIAFNVILSPVRLRKDVTQDKLYTLSDGTKTLLKELDRDVTLKFYFSKSNERIPIPLKNFAGRVRDLLKEYESHSGGHLTITEYDPKIDSDEEEWAQRYGLRGQPLDMFGAGGNLYFGIVAISGNNEAAIPLLTQNIEPQLEYMLTRMVSEVSKQESVKIGLMSSLPVQGKGRNPYMPPSAGSKGWAVISELEQQYEVEKIEMDANEIPTDIDTLIIIQPAGISDTTLYAIDQFVLRGGHLLAFTDPMCLTAQDDAPQQQYGMPPPATAADLNKLTSAWGLNMPAGQLVADEAAASMLSTGMGQAQRNAAWLSLREKNINRKDITTSSLKELMLPFAGTFSGTVTEGLKMTTLLSSADDGFLANSYAARSGKTDIPDTKSKLPIAIRIQGKFKTAFPDGKPVEDENTETENADTDLKESIKDGVVILVADVDMLADRFCIRNLNVFGQTIAQPINQNISFTMNIVEQLCGSEALIGLRSRNSFDRPFDRVIKMEKSATEKWQVEEKRLDQKLQETQSRLAALQQTKNDGEQLMLSPEQQEEIKKFREETFQTQQALKEVRKNLRSDIEKLGMRLKAINILLIPLLIAILGIWHGIRIRKTR